MSIIEMKFVYFSLAWAERLS